MMARLRIFPNGKVHCPFCSKAAYPRGYNLRKLRAHFKNIHSLGGTYKFTLGEIVEERRTLMYWIPLLQGGQPVIHPRKRYITFSIQGPCGCGCGQVLRYPLRPFTPSTVHKWALPDRAPPFYANGHPTRMRTNDQNHFKKGHLSWNKGTKGLTGANGGSFKKGQRPANYNGGLLNAEGYIYVLTKKRHPCGQPKYISRARTIGTGLAGRPLTPNDVVLHLDGNPSNDDPKNLKVVTRAESLKLKYAKLRAGRNISPGVCGRCKTLKPDPAGPCPRCGRKNNQGYIVDGPNPVKAPRPGRPRAPKAPVLYGPPRPPGRPRKIWPPPPPKPRKITVTQPLPNPPPIEPPAPLFTTPTCPICGTLILNRSRPCPRCSPDHEHLPPSPKPCQVRMEQEEKPGEDAPCQ
jgi:hypothetical protein